MAASVTGTALLIHAWHAIGTGCYVDFVTGVWFALADDLNHGVFYRDLIGPDGYGGTRYFPVFFSLIGIAMRLGAGSLLAGFIVSLFSGALLVVGLRRFFLKLGLPPALAVSIGLFAFAPPFAQQALLAIRSDVLAAALVVWGLSCTLPAFDEERPRNGPLAAAGVLFILAAATKVTSLCAPAAAIVALALAARFAASARLGLIVALGTTAVVAVVAAVSNGRAIESWRACALAGVGLAEWLRGAPSAFLTQVIGPSRVFVVVFAAAASAWLVMLFERGPRLPVVLFPAALGATLVVLASPGTSYTNQLVELFTVCVLLVGWAVARHPRLWTPAGIILLLLSLGVARNSLLPVLDAGRRQYAQRMSAERVQLVRDLAAPGGPILSESPELMTMAGLRPYMIDPFALRVVTLRRRDILRDVERKLDLRYFSAVVLKYDPESPEGRGWYTNMDFGWPITSNILANYDLALVKAGFRVYRPKPPAPTRGLHAPAVESNRGTSAPN